MLNPIYQDGQIICHNCGCVLREIEDTSPPIPYTSHENPTVDLILLGSAVDKAVRSSLRSPAKQVYEERILRQLIDVTKKFCLPESFAIAAFNQLKRDKSGFRSELQPIKKLLKILSKDENYIYNQKMRAIKAAYEISSM